MEHILTFCTLHKNPGEFYHFDFGTKIKLLLLNVIFTIKIN